MCETKFSLILIQEQLIVGFLCVAHVVYCCCVENSNFCSRSHPARAERVNRKSIRDEDMWGKFRCLFLPLRPRLLLLVVGVAKKLWKKLKNLVAHHTRLKQTRVCLCVLRRFGWKTRNVHTGRPVFAYAHTNEGIAWGQRASSSKRIAGLCLDADEHTF